MTNTTTTHGVTSIIMTMNVTTTVISPPSTNTVITVFSNSNNTTDISRTLIGVNSYFGGLPSPLPARMLPKLNQSAPPTNVDWRAVGKVSPVKDQGRCGSCWTFSSIGSVESLNLINNSATNATSNFSEQTLVDCDTYDGGCNSGNPGSAFDWLELNGIATEASYPYYSGTNNGTSNGTGKCSSISKGNFRIYGAATLYPFDIVALQNAVAMQPIVVLINANGWSGYKAGVINVCANNTDHAVLLVGYTPQYWIIKNSWSSGWGMGGFIYLDKTNSTCNHMISSTSYLPLASPQVADQTWKCPYYPSYYCTDNNYKPYMMRKIYFIFINFIIFWF